MAALGFSVLMREWRRGMAFDPWHGSLYLKLSAVITLFPSFSLSLCYRWRNRPAPLDLIKSSQARLTLFRTGIQIPPAASAIRLATHPSPFMTTLKVSLLIDHVAGKEKERQRQICENIILFVELRNEHGSQSSCSNFISYVCPNHTRASWFFKKV